MPRAPQARATARRRLLPLAAIALGALAAGLLTGRGAGDEPRRVVPAELRAAGVEALAYDPSRREDFEARAAAGLSHVLYAKSPGGALASARRTARWRGLVEEVAERHVADPDDLEALVLLESAGRPDALASADLEGAAGLTQILAQTGRDLLGLRVDVAASTRLTRAIARGGPPEVVRAREARRRRVDERFDPRKALEATGRYLTFARAELGDRDDLALAAYHMGVGNLQGVLRRFGAEPAEPVPYAELFFDSSPLRHAAAWRALAALGDDSSTYLWRIGAAREILRLLRGDPRELARREALHAAAGSAELALHPPGETPAYEDVEAAQAALDDPHRGAGGALVALEREDLAAHGLRDGTGPVSDPALRSLRPEALAVLRLIGDGTKAIARTRPLVVAEALAAAPTGWTFALSRRYRSGAQAQALQFMLDRLQALDLIAWERRADTIRVTASERAATLLMGG